MPSDARAVQARREHRLSVQVGQRAERHRQARNRLIKELRAEDPELWTYPALGAAVGISEEMARAIVDGRTG